MATIAVSTFPSANETTKTESPLEGNPHETNTCGYKPETESLSEDFDLEEFEFSSFESYVEVEVEEEDKDEEEEEDEDEDEEEVEEEEDPSKSVHEGEKLKFDLSISDDEDDEEEDIYEEETESSRAQMAEYVRQVLESDGFDVDDFPEIEGNMNIIIPISDLHDKDNGWFPEVEYFTKFAIRNYRGEEGEEDEARELNLELVKIVKANVQAWSPLNYYITFEAKDMDDGGRLKTYQTRVLTQIVTENSVVEFFREKPAHY